MRARLMISLIASFVATVVAPGISRGGGIGHLASVNQLLLSFSAGITSVVDLTQDGSSTIVGIVNYDNAIYILGAIGNNIDQFGLYRSDGTVIGTKLIKKFPYGGFYGKRTFYSCDNKIYFSAVDEITSDFVLWESDGTTAGTLLVVDGSGGRLLYPHSFVLLNNNIYFVADDKLSHTKLWKINKLSSVAEEVAGVVPDYSDVALGVLGDYIYFSSTNDSINHELWRTDGTESGTIMFKNIGVGSSSYPSNFMLYNNELFFSAEDGTNGVELWKTDGTVDGTVIVKDIDLDYGSYPQDLTVYNNELYFTSIDINGRNLWKTDGTSAGTVMVKDIYLNSIWDNTGELFVFDRQLVFVADDGSRGKEPWVTTGTSNGTKLLRDIYTGPTSSHPRRFVQFRGDLYFVACDEAEGYELRRFHP